MHIKSEIKFRKPQKSAEKSAVDLMQPTTPTAFNQSFATSPIQTSKNPVLVRYFNGLYFKKIAILSKSSNVSLSGDYICIGK